VFSVKNISLEIENIKISKFEDIPDLIIFNFQEIVPLSAKSMISTGVQPQLWENYIIQKLNKWLCEQVKEHLEIQNVQLVDKLASHV
jgi:hypothetical protein